MILGKYGPYVVHFLAPKNEKFEDGAPTVNYNPQLGFRCGISIEKNSFPVTVMK